MPYPSFFMGGARPVGAQTGFGRLLLPAHHLVTHGVIVGTTGSGKTGLVTVMIEEALRNQVPVLVIDVKGDLPNLLLNFPDFSPESLLPWVEGAASPSELRPPEEIAKELASTRQQGLAAWDIDESVLRQFRSKTALRVVTPGATAGELLHMLSGLERPSGGGPGLGAQPPRHPASARPGRL
jgi:hypothetical protein